jgi:hypothetical protein
VEGHGRLGMRMESKGVVVDSGFLRSETSPPGPLSSELERGKGFKAGKVPRVRQYPPFELPLSSSAGEGAGGEASKGRALRGQCA